MRAAQDVDVLTDQAPLRRAGRGLVLALSSALVVVAADRLSKIWVENRLMAGPCRPNGDECIDLLFGARLHLVHNHGAAFSTGTRLGPLFGLVAVAMTVVLFRLAATGRDWTRSLLLGLIAGGAMGNLIDRVVRAEDGPLSGGVIDFIDLRWWPVFNLADSAVVVGVVVFVLHSLRQPGPSHAPDPAPLTELDLGAKPEQASKTAEISDDRSVSESGG